MVVKGMYKIILKGVLSQDSQNFGVESGTFLLQL